MSAELRLTVGELGFAVGVVATLGRALELVRGELGAADDAAARAVLAASSHSLVVRQLAVRAGDEIRLAPALRSAAAIVAASASALRCERVAGRRVDSLAFHLAPAGVVAQAVEDDVVLRLRPVAGTADLVERAAAFFELPTFEVPASAPPARIESAAMRELGRLGPHADLGAELARRGVPLPIGTRFAADLAEPRWKGTITHTRWSASQEPVAELLAALVAGVQIWFIDARNPAFATLSLATRAHLAEAAAAAVRDLEPASADRAGLA